MKFAFIVHPLGMVTQQLNALQPSELLRTSWGTDLPAFCRQLQDEVELARQRLIAPRGGEIRIVDSLPKLVSVTGDTAEGRLYEIPQTPAELLQDPQSAYEAVVEAVRQAADWGAKIVGLGALTGTLGAGGSLIAEQSPVAVTTGNSLTVFAAVENVRAVCQGLEIDLREETLAIIGAPGSIAAATARLLAPECGKLLLVGRGVSPRLKKLADDLKCEVATSIPGALAQSRLILTATSSGLCLDPHDLQPGSVVWDVAVPADLLPCDPPRPDVLLLSSGLTALPAPLHDGGGYLWLHRGVIPSCLGETMLLAFERRAESYSLGRQLESDRIAEIGAYASKHQFDFSRMFAEGLPLSESNFVQFRQHRQRVQPKPRRLLAPVGLGDSRRALAETRFRRHVNPVHAAIAEHAEILRTFVRGEGSTLWDREGQAYLDFVAGFGSVNLGHNPPRVVAAIQEALQSSAPGFSPGSVNPYAAALAERLVMLAPPGLEQATFVNSGAEAIEAALKLARAATGRRRLVAVDRGYHGKTCGALSVTANPVYRQPFEPLLPDCERIPFGDLGSLEHVLCSRQAAGLILEPIAAEGGMHPLPDGYLKRARELCLQTGTLLILDEVQTGLGRTGRLFACDADDVVPDVLCLAKSLGGGLVPIGAMLSQRTHWMRAYGSLETCLLQTSTFAGGSLACAAALATLDVLEDSAVLENTMARGHELAQGLRSLANRYRVIREVRGRGLLLGVEFAPLPDVIAAHWADRAGFLSLAIPALRERIDALPAFYVMQSLLRKHHIFTQLCRSQTCVLRVEPPLTISSEQVRRFLDAFEASIREIELTNVMFATCLSKTVRGELDWLAAANTAREPSVSASHGESASHSRSR